MGQRPCWRRPNQGLPRSRESVESLCQLLRFRESLRLASSLESLHELKIDREVYLQRTHLRNRAREPFRTRLSYGDLHPK